MYVPRASSPVSRHCPCVPLDIDPPERGKRDVILLACAFLTFVTEYARLDIVVLLRFTCAVGKFKQPVRCGY